MKEKVSLRMNVAENDSQLVPDIKISNVKVVPADPEGLVSKVLSLEGRVEELEGDLIRFAKVLSDQAGHPVSDFLADIVHKKQGK